MNMTLKRNKTDKEMIELVLTQYFSDVAHTFVIAVIHEDMIDAVTNAKNVSRETKAPGKDERTHGLITGYLMDYNGHPFKSAIQDLDYDLCEMERGMIAACLIKEDKMTDDDLALIGQIVSRLIMLNLNEQAEGEENE